jgi:hypothetical protein
LNRDKAIEWLRKGAQPTETVEILLKKASIVPSEVRKGEAPVDAGMFAQGPDQSTRSAPAATVTAPAAPAASETESAPAPTGGPAEAEITLEIDPDEVAVLEDSAE